MFFKKLESKPVKVANGKGLTGNVTYWAFGYLGKARVRKPLGTDRAGVADTRVEWIKRACEEGAGSGYWAQLKDCLPSNSFMYFGALVGYKEVSSVAKVEATWTDLRASYIAALDAKILNDAMTESTKATYMQSLKEFDKFVALRGFATLADITEKVIVEDFKSWRKKAILARVNAGTKAKRLAFDLTILRAAFSHTKSEKWLEAGFDVMKNPVPTMKRDQKPGATQRTKPSRLRRSNLLSCAQRQTSRHMQTVRDASTRSRTEPICWPLSFCCAQVFAAAMRRRCAGSISGLIWLAG
jgi:hypothetical protein